MKILLLVFAVIFSLQQFAFSNHNQRLHKPDEWFYCPPCGCKSDHKKLPYQGDCQSCGMQLIKVKEGVSGQTANLLSNLFRQNRVSNLYFDRLMYPVFFIGLILSFLLITKVHQNRANLFLAMITFALSIYPIQNRITSLSRELTDSSTTLMFLPLSFIL